MKMYKTHADFCEDFAAENCHRINCASCEEIFDFIKPELALSFNKGKILKCEVDLKDIVVYPHNIDKVRCRKVKVLGEL